MDTKTENYWKILETNLEMSRYADAKATAVLSICGILVTLAFSNVEALFNSSANSWVLIGMVFLPGLTIMVSVFYSFRSIHPRIVPHEQVSYLFFGSIAHDFKSADHYYKALSEEMETEDGIKDQLARQIFITAQLASEKFRDVKYSIRFFATSIAIAVLEFMGYFFHHLIL